MKVAVAIPARNAAHLIEDCLRAVADQRRAPDEIWVAVPPSDRATTESVLAAAAGGLKLQIVENHRGDRGSGLNEVIARTDADVIGFVDAQATLHPDYLSAALDALETTGASVVGGQMRPVGGTAVGLAMAAALQSPFGVGDSQFHFARSPGPVDSVYLGVYRSEAFERIGRYNTALLRTEDDDLNARIRDAGMTIWFDPDIHSAYRCRDSLSGIWSQYFGYGSWKAALLAVRPGSLRPRHLAPLALVAGLVVTAVMGVTATWWPFVALVGVWAAAAIVFAVRAPASKVSTRVLFPVVTATMHLAYGIGTVVGLARLPFIAGRVRAAAADARVPPVSGSRS